MLAGCRAKEPAPASSSTPVAEISATPSPTAEERSQEDLEYHIVAGVYDSCEIYETAIDFIFQTEDGDVLRFRNSRVPGEKPSLKVPLDLTTSSQDGSLKPNPKWQGQRFLLTLDDTDQVLSLEPLPPQTLEQTKSEEPPEPVESNWETAAANDWSEEEEDISPEIAEVAQPESQVPLVDLTLPAGYTSRQEVSQGETTVTVTGGAGELQIVLSEPGANLNQMDTERLFETNGWSKLDTQMANKPSVGWASNSLSFSGVSGEQGQVWLGQIGDRQVRMEVSAAPEALEEHLAALRPVIEGFRLR